MTYEQLATQLRAHRAVELAMTQVQALQAIKTAEALLASQDLDIIRAGLESLAHLDITHIRLGRTRAASDMIRTAPALA